jgi:hypothetical protein
MEGFWTMKTKQEQVAEWMESTPVIRQMINRVLVEIVGEDRRAIFDATYDENAPFLAEQEAHAARKIWPNAAAFLGGFSMPELAAISLSTDPTVAALRLLLASWPSDVWSDDPRIVMGLGALVSAGIIDETRSAEIVAKD